MCPRLLNSPPDKINTRRNGCGQLIGIFMRSVLTLENTFFLFDKNRFDKAKLIEKYQLLWIRKVIVTKCVEKFLAWWRAMKNTLLLLIVTHNLLSQNIVPQLAIDQLHPLLKSSTKMAYQKLTCNIYLTDRCPWCNCYCRRKWTRRHEFKSWTRLIAFHIALIPLGKVWIQLFSLQLWVNSRTD